MCQFGDPQDLRMNRIEPQESYKFGDIGPYYEGANSASLGLSYLLADLSLGQINNLIKYA